MRPQFQKIKKHKEAKSENTRKHMDKSQQKQQRAESEPQKMYILEHMVSNTYIFIFREIKGEI